MDVGALKNQVLGLSRGGIWFAAGFTVGYGVLNGETAVTIAGALIAAIGSGWTGVANSNSSITQAFSAIPSTKQIVTSDPVLAEVAKKADPETIVRTIPEKEILK